MFGKSAYDKGYVVGEQVAESALTDEEITPSLYTRLAGAAGVNLDSLAGTVYMAGFEDGIAGWTWCATCRMTMPPVHECVE